MRNSLRLFSCLLSVSCLIINAAPVTAQTGPDLVCQIQVNDEVYTSITNKIIVIVPDPGEAVNDFQVKLEVDDDGGYTEIGTNFVSGAFGWGDAFSNFTWSPAADGGYTLRATVDPGDNVEEASEDNNQATQRVTAGPVTSKTVNVRIEGQTETIWSGEVTFTTSTITDKYDDTYMLDYPTALGAIHTASMAVPFDLVVDSMFSPVDYVESVAGEVADGMNGWMYRVNWVSPNFGANEYALSDGDLVLWSYTSWMSQPLRTTVSSNSILSGETMMVTVEAYEGTGWDAVGAGMPVHVGALDYTTDAGGEVKDLLLDPGSYIVYADADDYTQYIRSNREEVLVYSGSLVAETSLAPCVEPPVNGLAMLEVNLNKVYDLDTSLEVTPADGIGEYSVTLAYDGENGINILAVEGVAPFSEVTPGIDDAAGTTEFGASLTAAGPNPPVTLARFAPRLIGSAGDTYTITLIFTVINDGEGGDIDQEIPAPVMNLRRGDVQGDGDVDITDAMFVAQYLVGLRDPGEGGFYIINGASVKHDSVEGDRIDIVDAMYIAQHKVGMRDEYFERVP